MHRHRRYSITDSESEYSESDISMMEVPRKHYRRRSVSRTRLSPSYSNTYLSPNTLHEDVRIHRSASTGARRTREERERRERDRDRLERDRVQPTAVIVDIKNDSRNTSSNKNRKQHRHLEDTTYLDISDDETILRRQQRRRPRASTSVSRSRDASPLNPARDYDLLIDQRMLERNDQRQDLELLRQQQEIERLERELARHRGDHEIRLLKEEEDRYEDDISDRLRRLQHYEESERLEEEKRKAERRIRLQRLEKAEREAAEQEEVRQKLRYERLKELQRKIDEEEERERIKKEIKDEEARIALAESERKAKEAAMKQAAVEEWKLAEERRKIAEREAAARRDKEFRERLRLEFGYTEEEIEDIINKKHKKEGKEGKKKEEKKEEKKKEKEEEEKEERKATWIKVHRKHLIPETLIAYQLPWAFDELDGNYIIIKKWISEELQEELFNHTRRIREGKLVAQTSSTLTELKVNDRKKDKMYLVRKKSPSRRSWIFT
ncbi:uncharacterized protein BJX67DRAFT_175451 [Aspergillus lucknowensis]|uniref:Uncharacterized protein n=1 Tax=Aspergillus lucknowensis TaxID=176173 RepID=A0ABR4LLS0_9EURO